MRRRVVLVGAVIVVAYLATLSATVARRDGNVRPLYDGLAAPAAYRFVNPPAFFAPTNVKPTAASATIALHADGSAQAGIATPDGQFVISLGRGAVAPAAGATEISVRITPIDPGSLGPLPALSSLPATRPLRPSGNAYHLEMTYEPSGHSVTRLVKPGTLLMEIPEIAENAFASTDGKRWTRLATRVLLPKQLTMTATLSTSGYYVAGTDQASLAARTKRSSRAALVLGLCVVLLAALIFLAVYLAKSPSSPPTKTQKPRDTKPQKRPLPMARPGTPSRKRRR